MVRGPQQHLAWFSGTRPALLNMIRVGLIVAIPAAVVVIFLTVRYGGERAYLTTLLAGAWAPAVAGVLRDRSAVVAVSCVEAVLALIWTGFVLLAAEPCTPAGAGILTPSPGCPVQATHVVGAVVGGASSIALGAGILGGFVYASTGDERAHRLFRNCLLVGGILILVWLAGDRVLPRVPRPD